VNRSPPRSKFPLELAKLLAARQYGITMLAKVMTRRGHPITKQFLHQISNGVRPAPVAQVGHIADVLECSDPERTRLYRAAALDEGYEI
jgi:hypothetical protein